MPKVLVINYDKCVGCRTCMQACSAKKEGGINLAKSRRWVITSEIERLTFIPIGCQHCVSAPCAAICPVGAISRDEALARVIINQDACIGCRMCMAVCPFGCINFNTIDRKVFKCDLCDGDPICVRFCQHKALEYLEVDEQSVVKYTSAANKLAHILSKPSLIEAIPSN